MKIIIKPRKKSNIRRHDRSGIIESTQIGTGCTMKIFYQENPKFFVDLQKLLLRYYDLKIISNRRKNMSKIFVPELLDSRLKQTAKLSTLKTHAKNFKKMKGGSKK